jgi:hypothetical protein
MISAVPAAAGARTFTTFFRPSGFAPAGGFFALFARLA